jgi:hypothetical protein
MEDKRGEYRLDFIMTMVLGVFFGVGIGFVFGIMGGGSMSLGSKLSLVGILSIVGLPIYFISMLANMDNTTSELEIKPYKYQNHIIFSVGILSLIGGGILGGKVVGKTYEKKLE